MLESLILLLFFIIGGGAALLALLLLVVARNKKSKILFKIGLGVAIVPCALYALVFWFYDIYIPSVNYQQERDYVGSYVMVMPNHSYEMDNADEDLPRLLLRKDNSFWLEKNSVTSFSGEGTWRAGATDDGQFEFRDKSDGIVFWMTPADGKELQLDGNFGGGQKIVFAK